MRANTESPRQRIRVAKRNVDECVQRRRNASPFVSEEERKGRAFALPSLAEVPTLRIVASAKIVRRSRLISRYAIATIRSRQSLRGVAGPWNGKLRDMESMEFRGCETQCTLVFKVGGRL